MIEIHKNSPLPVKVWGEIFLKFFLMTFFLFQFFLCQGQCFFKDLKSLVNFCI
jgi:hypothetical protein